MYYYIICINILNEPFFLYFQLNSNDFKFTSNFSNLISKYFLCQINLIHFDVLLEFVLLFLKYRFLFNLNVFLLLL